MSCDADGYSDVYDVRYPRARIDHTCCAYRETIRRGDRYRYTFHVWEGEPGTFKHCLRCAAMIDAISAAQTDPDETVDAELACGHTWEENFGEVPPEVAALAFMTADEAQSRLWPKGTFT